MFLTTSPYIVCCSYCAYCYHTARHDAHHTLHLGEIPSITQERDRCLYAYSEQTINCYRLILGAAYYHILLLSQQCNNYVYKLIVNIRILKLYTFQCSMLTNVGKCTFEIKSRIAMGKAAFNKKRVLFTSTLDLKLRKKLVKCYNWSIALYGAETWTLRAVD